MKFPVAAPDASRERRIAVLADRAELSREYRSPPNFFYEDEALNAAVISDPEADEPRQAYASWLLRHQDEDTRTRGTCIAKGLELARDARKHPEIDFAARRELVPIPSQCWQHMGPLFDDGLIDGPHVHRGFVESVMIKASTLVELADELFAAAPLRFLSLFSTASAVDQLAGWPGLSKIHAIEFPVLSDDDLLTDETIDLLLESPYLTNITAIKLIGQTRLTSAAYRRLVTATTLPKLSLLEVVPKVLTCWAQPVEVWPTSGRRLTMTFFEGKIIGPPKSGDLRDTPIHFIQRPEDWIVELERELGYQPCLHPEEHYGRYHVELEVAIEHPIALDAAIMARRGQPVPERGPKPSLMERFAKGVCAICGSAVITHLGPSYTAYDDPLYILSTGSMDCPQCGTSWSMWSPNDDRYDVATSSA